MSNWLYNEMDEKIGESKYFKWKEALWLPQMEAYAVATEEQKRNIERQAVALDKIREYFGVPVIVTSWLRPEAYNKFIGGATKSFHRLGLATDFIVQGLDCADVKREIRTADLYPGRGEYDTTNWIHLDLGGTEWFYARS